MAYEKLKTILQTIESTATNASGTLTELQQDLAAIKSDTEAALELDMPEDVKTIIEAMKVVACTTYQSVMEANAALASIAASAAIAISLLGK